MAAREISQTRLSEWLTGDDDSRMCRDIPDEACREQPRNFFLHLAAALGNKLADELASARLVLPWLLGMIGAPLWMVGLLVPIREAGALLPQMFIAGFIRLKPERKWVWVLGGTLQAIAAGLLALLALFGHGGLGGAQDLCRRYGRGRQPGPLCGTLQYAHRRAVAGRGWPGGPAGPVARQRRTAGRAGPDGLAAAASAQRLPEME